MKDLPQLCKGVPEHVPRIANILTQLLQSEDLGEISLIQSGLLSLFRIDPKGIVHISGVVGFLRLCEIQFRDYRPLDIVHKTSDYITSSKSFTVLGGQYLFLTVLDVKHQSNNYFRCDQCCC